MKSQTTAIINELKTADWLISVGKKDTQNAHVLSSWDEAIASCSSHSWQDLLLEAQNQYTEKLALASKERFNTWNSIAEEVKNITIPLVEQKTAETIQLNELPKIFIDTVQWDIFHLAMEAEFSDIIEPGFYASQGYWYIHGHFPEGRLAIY